MDFGLRNMVYGPWTGGMLSIVLGTHCFVVLIEYRSGHYKITIQQLQVDLKMSKDEVKRFSSMLLHRESRFTHDIKKKDQELGKLKERLLKVISETKNGARNHVSIGNCFNGQVTLVYARIN